MHASVEERLARLTPDQRDAATAPPGPVLCVAPAGSGKTTTLVARIAWLVDGGVDPATIAAITFNKRAAEELGVRADAALASLDVEPGAVRVRTFHALGREILRDAGRPVEPLVDRDALFSELWPRTTTAERGRLDTAFSRLKLDLGVGAEEIAADPDAGPVARAFVEYETALADRGSVDFDDLVRGALLALEGEAALLERWREPLRAPARRRGAGRGSVAAPPRTPARRSGTSDLPGRATTTSRSTAGGSPTCGGCWPSASRCRVSGASTSR